MTSRRIIAGIGAATVAAAVLVTSLTAAAPVDAAGGREGGRIAGADRIATSVEVSQRAFADGADTAYLASARVPFDAQVGATLGDGPILLVEPCGPIDVGVLAELDRLGVTRVDVLGGPVAVADNVHRQALHGAYDGAADDCPGAVPSSRDGITLTVREVDGQYALDVTNARDDEVVGGEGYVLERLVGAAYVRTSVTPARGRAPDDAIEVAGTFTHS